MFSGLKNVLQQLELDFLNNGNINLKIRDENGNITLQKTDMFVLKSL